ncbi:MAG: DUF6263 family protein [Planctomycetota bacterium]
MNRPRPRPRPRSRIPSVWLVVLVIFAAAPASAEEHIKLALKLKPKQSITVDIITKRQTQQEVGGTDLGMEMTIGETLRYDVLDRQSVPGGYWFRVTYMHCRFKQVSQFANIDYDSEQPATEIHPVARGYAGLVNREFFVEVNRDGQVVQIQGEEGLVEEILAAMNLPEGARKEGARQGLEIQLSEESLRQTLQLGAGVYPRRLIRVGSTWNDEQSFGGFMSMAIKTRFWLAGFDDDSATLRLSSQITPPALPTPIPAPATAPATATATAPATAPDDPPMNPKWAGTQTGTIILDRATGWPTSTELTQKLQGEIAFEHPTAGMSTMQLSISSSVSMAVIDGLD